MRAFLPTAATIAAAASAFLPWTAASAAPPPGSGAASSPVRHCVVHLTESGRVSCYATFTEAINDATNGTIADAPENARSAVVDKGFNVRLNALATPKGRAAGIASTVIEISFEHKDFQGTSLTWEASSGCNDSNDVEWQAASVSGWWNDQISSFRTYAKCQSDHWEDINFQGISTGYRNTTSYIGNAMNDRTSSIKWI
ncbi:beta/gamma crystallin family protein [Actinomadura terrae]|uniref:beta/gamma crystallin family protein n=1 Tax=Actinomadura terrae TaxID=604353 RepID=UPI001FA7A547|nr:beta/gamma crystallin family protein [Actinomadura terrae]